MKKTAKRMMASLLAFVVLATQIVGVGLITPAYAAESTAQTHYFYDQLPSSTAKNFYNAMSAMAANGDFKTGTNDYDLLANGVVTQDEIVAYTNGDPQLLNAMGLARDAFTADHPEVFYVDFTLLSMTVTKDKSGQYHAYLGTGRSDNYFAEGFTSQEQVEKAIDLYNARVAELVAGATGSVSDQVKYVHDQIINTTSYRMEGLCATGSEGFIHTSYGPLVTGEGVCEGYAEAMKVVLDQLGIPCILVQGMVRADDNSAGELHMWNYVQVDGQWYAVDATWDDPVNQNNNVGVTDGIDGYENTQYLLASEVTMNVCHTPSGVWTTVESAANFAFTYPALSIQDLGFAPVSDDNGLVVQYKADGQAEGYLTGEFKVSYLGMGYAAAAAKGYYILTRMYTDENTSPENWGYLDPTPYSTDTEYLKDSPTEITLAFPQIRYMEFAVTDIPPTTNSGDVTKDYWYTGDTALLLAVSPKLENEQASYLAPPYIASVTPATTGRLKVGSTYSVSVTFDEDLKLDDSISLMTLSDEDTVQTAQLGYEVTSYDPDRTVNSASARCTVENIQWDGKRTVTFDFTPSEYWSDDTVMYYIQITGLVGALSNKLPNPVGYAASHGCVAYAYRNQGFDWNVFGKPALMEDASFGETTNGGVWTDSNGNNITDQLTSLKSRLVLVTTEAPAELAAATEAETVAAIDKVNGDDQILASKTYNINLTLCKSQIISTGQSLRVSVGFPEGYDASSVGVTFKAYHFDENGTPEEVECVITQYGLVISCSSFSPYAIVAVKDETASTTPSATVIVSSTTGGTVTGADSGVFTLQENESRTLTVTPDSGYQIESISVGGKNVALSNTSGETVTATYDQVANNGVVDVKFVSTSAVERMEQSHPDEVLVAQPVVVLADTTNNTTTGGDSSTTTGGDSSTTTGGDSSTTTGGDSSTTTGGDSSTTTGGSTSTTTGGSTSTTTGGSTSTTTSGSSSSTSSSSSKSDTSSTAASTVASPEETGVSSWLNTTPHTAYLAGYEDGTFAPDRNMTRAEVATMFYGLLLNKDVPVTRTFTDVSDGEWYTTAVNTLASLGMISGYSDGTFQPNGTITRAEFTAMAMAFAKQTATSENKFSDVSQSDWFYPYVSSAAQYGWVGGYGDGTFLPNGSITREEAVTIANNILGRQPDKTAVDQNQNQLKQFSDVSPDRWSYYNICEATNNLSQSK